MSAPSKMVEYQGAESPSVVVVVSRRWDIDGDPWEIIQSHPSGDQRTICADLNALIQEFVGILGVEIKVSQGAKH